MANSYLYRTPSAGNLKTWTFSAWIKKCSSDGNNKSIFCTSSANNTFSRIYTNGQENLTFYDASSGNTVCYLESTAMLRDANAWYHIVITLDSTQSTADNRIKMYINGTQQTAFDYRTNPSQNADLEMNKNTQHNVGKNGENLTAEYWDGYMSHVHFTDGYAYAASDFGETDSTTGEWKIKTSPNVNYGTNGWFILKNNNTGTDQSPNSNNYTASGNLTKSEDCPSNVFATLNPLSNWRGQSHTAAGALSKGNNTTGIGSSEKTLIASTIGVTSGKWYWEAKSDGVSKMFFGICNKVAFADTSAPHDSAGYNGIYYYEAIPDFRANTGDGAITTGISSITSGDVLCFALDMDNWAFYIGKNGTWMNSGDPTSGASKTGAISELFSNGTWYMRYNEEVFASCYVSSTSGSGTASYNFGNGYFGTTAVSSAGTNASGIGIFEYDVPTGFTALSTKGLNL